LRRYPIRFDVVTLEPAAGGLRIEWLRSAFHA
jgi:Holliday junction resolvase-like predicted endonuclease